MRDFPLLVQLFVAGAAVALAIVAGVIVRALERDGRER